MAHGKSRGEGRLALDLKTFDMVGAVSTQHAQSCTAIWHHKKARTNRRGAQALSPKATQIDSHSDEFQLRNRNLLARNRPSPSRSIGSISIIESSRPRFLAGRSSVIPYTSTSLHSMPHKRQKWELETPCTPPFVVNHDIIPHPLIRHQPVLRNQL